MSQESERRSDEAKRVAIEAEVEVGPSLGPAFDAQAVNVSEQGMALRTAYLPEIGQRLSCRFDVDDERAVLVSGEVVWCHGGEDGGEFGIRFDELDRASQELLHRYTRGIPQKSQKVRLYIEGLAQPMRMTVKDERDGHMIVESELGFLKMGRPLELEDAGLKRPAVIERVEVEVHGVSQIPQLVVSLKYQDFEENEGIMNGQETESMDEEMQHGDDVDMGSSMDEAPDMSAAEETTDRDAVEMHAADLGDMDDEVQRGSEAFKSPFLKKAEEWKPVLDGFIRRAKTTAKLLAEKSFSKDKGESGTRRVTAPAPSGGLHADGRRVVRTSMTNEAAPPAKLRLTRKNITIGAGAMAVILFGAIAMKKTAAPPTDVTADATKGSEAQKVDTKPIATTELTTGALVFPDQPIGSGQVVATGQITAPNYGAGTIVGPSGAFQPVQTGISTAQPLASEAKVGTFDDGSEPTSKKTSSRVVPFGDKGLTHGNVLRLKMDGPIESIQGASQGTGFTVVIPHRRAVEPASPLASRDSRLDAMKVTNESNGAELSVSFNDSVPNYVVRAKGDTLEIVLARQKSTAIDHGSVAKAAHAADKHPHKTKHKKK